MARAPGMSVRLKLTLSYAGFLMLAGALLLGVVWVFLLRYVPDQAFLVNADAEQQGAREHEEGGVAEGELEADAHPWGSSHGRLPRARCRRLRRCGSRRRPRWR